MQFINDSLASFQKLGLATPRVLCHATQSACEPWQWLYRVCPSVRGAVRVLSTLVPEPPLSSLTLSTHLTTPHPNVCWGGWKNVVPRVRHNPSVVPRY